MGEYGFLHYMTPGFYKQTHYVDMGDELYPRPVIDEEKTGHILLIYTAITIMTALTRSSLLQTREVKLLFTEKEFVIMN